METSQRINFHLFGTGQLPCLLAYRWCVYAHRQDFKMLTMINIDSKIMIRSLHYCNAVLRVRVLSHICNIIFARAAHTHTYTHTHTHTHTYTHTHIHTYIHTHKHTSTQTHTCMHAHTHTHTHTCMYASTHAHIHTVNYVLYGVFYGFFILFLLFCF